MEMSNKRMYSINMAVFLSSYGFPYTMGLDETTGKVYWRFPESEEVRKAIYTYKTDESLHKFISQFYIMKEDVKRFKTEQVIS